MVAIPSVTSAGTRQIAEFCAGEVLGPRRIKAELLASSKEGAEQVNLVAFVEGANRDATPLLLNTHLDTVPPGDPALWTECRGKPFEASISGDRIYGLGTADTKLDFIAKTIALAECGRPGRDVWLVATFGEEHGLVGAKEIAAAGMIPRGAIAMVGEPSHLQVITAHKGLMAFELAIHYTPVRADREFETRKVVFSGRAAHSSTPALGENAIEKALAAIGTHPDLRVVAIAGGDAVNKVPARCEVVVAADFAGTIGGSPARKLGPAANAISGHAILALSKFAHAVAEFTRERSPAEIEFAAPTLTSNLGVVRTHHDTILLDFELRPPPSLALGVVRDGVNAIVSGLADRAPSLDLKLIEKRANHGFRSSGGSEAVELAMAALARARLPLETGVKTGCTEAGVYAAAGLQPVVFGPGPSTGVIHAPNEYNLLSEVEAAVRFYRALLE